MFILTVKQICLISITPIIRCTLHSVDQNKLLYNLRLDKNVYKIKEAYRLMKSDHHHAHSVTKTYNQLNIHFIF